MSFDPKVHERFFGTTWSWCVRTFGVLNLFQNNLFRNATLHETIFDYHSWCCVRWTQEQSFGHCIFCRKSSLRIVLCDIRSFLSCSLLFFKTLIIRFQSLLLVIGFCCFCLWITETFGTLPRCPLKRGVRLIKKSRHSGENAYVDKLCLFKYVVWFHHKTSM